MNSIEPVGEAASHQPYRRITGFPQPGFQDHVRDGIKVAVAAVPLVGGVIDELIDVVIRPSLAKRREHWCQVLAEVVDGLRATVEAFDLEALENNEAFVSAVIATSRVAAGTHRQEKLSYLRNVLVHVAMDRNSDDLAMALFIRMVEELEPEHFILLDYARDPGEWFKRRSLQLSGANPFPTMIDVMAQAQLPVTMDVAKLLIRDLDGRGLVDGANLNTMTVPGPYRPFVTEFGSRLLEFIAE